MARRSAKALPARAGVIDIGSNSVRLVAFDLRFGLALPLFNEKVICRLGAGLAGSGRLSDESVELALTSLRRFRLLTGALDLEQLFVLATSAVRDADNGPDFVATTQAIFEQPVRVLSGEEEARFSGLGVTAGLADADGVAGDLGGGSLELAAVADGHIGAVTSLPVGPLRLQALEPEALDAARAVVDRHLGEVTWLADLETRAFMAVGGAWRALALARMAKTGYPLRLIHGYVLPRSEADQLIKQVTRSDPGLLARMPGISRQRAETLPYAALLLGRILAHGRPGEVCFSAYGLREGYLAHELGLLELGDPLDAAVAWLAHTGEVTPAFRDLLMAWSEPLFAGESRAQRRLRRAACGLANLAWHEHTDYRGRQGFEAILRSTDLPVRHAERGFLALAILHRYGSTKQSPEAEAIQAIIPPRLARRARVLGLALRIAYRISGGTGRLLEDARLEVEGTELRLSLPAELDTADGIAGELTGLAKAAGLTTPGNA